MFDTCRRYSSSLDCELTKDPVHNTRSDFLGYVFSVNRDKLRGIILRKTTIEQIFMRSITCEGGSVAEWLACWTQAQKGPHHSRDAVG